MNGFSLEKFSILVVDDSPHMRRLIGAVLNEFGCRRIMEAESAGGALNQLKLSPADLILLDHQMPGVGGVEFATDLRRNPQSPCATVPIIMLTGHAKPEVVRGARDAGINEFLVKPFAPGKLMERVANVMSVTRTFIRNSTYVGPDRRRRLDPTYAGPERRKTHLAEVD